MRRKAEDLPRRACAELVLSLRPSRKLVRRSSSTHSDKINRLESTMSRYFGGTAIPVSDDVFEILLRQDGCKSLEQLCRETNIEIEQAEELMTELVELWEKRAIVLLPARQAGK